MKGGEGALQVEGDLTFATVVTLLDDSRELLGRSTEPLTVDLSAVGRADSAGLALLIEWMRRARAAERTLEFRAMPAQLHSLARASGLDTLFVDAPSG